MEIIVFSVFQLDVTYTDRNGRFQSRVDDYVELVFEDDLAATSVYDFFYIYYRAYEQGTDLTEVIGLHGNFITKYGRNIIDVVRNNDKFTYCINPSMISVKSVIDIIESEFPNRFIIRVAFRNRQLDKYAIPDVTMRFAQTEYNLHTIIKSNRNVIK